jgi:hypothetical protein
VVVRIAHNMEKMKGMFFNGKAWANQSQLTL